MTPRQAIRTLNELQGQIIHGNRMFAEIAEIIRNSERVRTAALFAVGQEISNAEAVCKPVPVLLLDAHRILATNHPDGELDMSALNQQTP